MAKNLIIHMDDIGINDGTVIAAKELFYNGTVTSASVIIPGSSAKEFCSWAFKNPQYDTGIHSTVTCEWDSLRWSSLFSKDMVPSIINGDGNMARGTEEDLQQITVDDYEHETIEQVNRALHWGLHPSHLDNHMWTMCASDSMLKMYLLLAKQFHIVPYMPSWSNYTSSRREIVQKADFDSQITIWVFRIIITSVIMKKKKRC